MPLRAINARTENQPTEILARWRATLEEAEQTTDQPTEEEEYMVDKIKLELDVTDDDVMEAAHLWNDWIIETRIRRGWAYHTNASPHEEVEATQDDFARLIHCVPILEAYFQDKLTDHLHKVFNDNARVWVGRPTTNEATRPILPDLETGHKDLPDDDVPF